MMTMMKITATMTKMTKTVMVTMITMTVMTTTTTMMSYIPDLFQLLGACQDVLVVSTLEQLVVGESFLELGAETSGRLGFLLETGVEVVEINLQIRQLYRQLISLLLEILTCRLSVSIATVYIGFCHFGEHGRARM